VSHPGDQAFHKGDTPVPTSLIHPAAHETTPSPTLHRSPLKACWFEHDQIAEGLDYGLATDGSALDQASRLQHDQYVAQGYMDPHPSGKRLSAHHVQPTTRVFVARSGSRVVATMTLIADSPLGLPMDAIYADELSGLRGTRRNLAEVSGLAVHPDYQRSGIAILLRLTRLLVLYAAELADLSDLCIAINPHHAAFYRKVFHFRPIGGLKKYGKVNGAPAVALRLDLAVAQGLMRELRNGQPVTSAVYSFLFSPENVDLVLARLAEDLEQVSPPGEHLPDLFSHHEAWASASPASRPYLVARGAPPAARKPFRRRPVTREPSESPAYSESLALALA
jgi:GNAT superfamily N-acetyltransferase